MNRPHPNSNPDAAELARADFEAKLAARRLVVAASPWRGTAGFNRTKVLTAFLDLCEDHGALTVAAPSRTLAKMTGLDPKSVSRHKLWLTKNKVLQMTKPGSVTEAPRYRMTVGELPHGGAILPRTRSVLPAQRGVHSAPRGVPHRGCHSAPYEGQHFFKINPALEIPNRGCGGEFKERRRPTPVAQREVLAELGPNAERVWLAFFDGPLSAKAASRITEVPLTTVRRVLKRLVETGRVEHQGDGWRACTSGGLFSDILEQRIERYEDEREKQARFMELVAANREARMAQDEAERAARPTIDGLLGMKLLKVSVDAQGVRRITTKKDPWAGLTARERLFMELDSRAIERQMQDAPRYTLENLDMDIEF